MVPTRFLALSKLMVEQVEEGWSERRRIWRRFVRAKANLTGDQAYFSPALFALQ